MELIAIIVALAAAVAGLLWWRTRSAGTDTAAKSPLDALDTLDAWEPTPTRILTAQERLAYTVLTRALPEHLILAQVPLSRFLKVPTRNSYTEWLNRVGQLSADLLVCDHSSAVVAIIDVRAPPHQQSERHRKRHERMKRVLKAAGIPLHVWIENALPTPDAAREAILGKPEEVVREPQPPIPTTQAVAAGKVRAVPTLDDETAGIMPDEIIEMTEPPPSTWFDNLESRPAPLRPAAQPGTPGQTQGPGGAKPPQKPTR